MTAQPIIVPTMTLALFSLPNALSYPQNHSSFDSDAFLTGIDGRDDCCVVCYASRAEETMHYVHIVEMTKVTLWEDIRRMGFLPPRVRSVANEPRNGIMLCETHHRYFSMHLFYVRWDAEIHRYVCVNHSQNELMEDYHGATLKLDPTHPHSPLPASFLLHEMCVRGSWPHKLDRPVEPFDPTARSLHHVVNSRSSFEPESNVHSVAHSRPLLLFTNPFHNTSFLEKFKESSRNLNSWRSLEIPDEWADAPQGNIEGYLGRQESEMVNAY